MGKNKIPIIKIECSRTRQGTFLKRKNGLLKKAMELSILCDCEIALFIHTPHNNKFVKYVSSNLDSILTQLKTHESEKILTNNDYERFKKKNFSDEDSFPIVSPSNKKNLTTINSTTLPSSLLNMEVVNSNLNNNNSQINKTNEITNNNTSNINYNDGNLPSKKLKSIEKNNQTNTRSKTIKKKKVNSKSSLSAKKENKKGTVTPSQTFTSQFSSPLPPSSSQEDPSKNFASRSLIPPNIERNLADTMKESQSSKLSSMSIIGLTTPSAFPTPFSFSNLNTPALTPNFSALMTPNTVSILSQNFFSTLPQSPIEIPPPAPALAISTSVNDGSNINFTSNSISLENSSINNERISNVGDQNDMNSSDGRSTKKRKKLSIVIPEAKDVSFERIPTPKKSTDFTLNLPPVSPNGKDFSQLFSPLSSDLVLPSSSWSFTPNLQKSIFSTPSLDAQNLMTPNLQTILCDTNSGTNTNSLLQLSPILNKPTVPENIQKESENQSETNKR